MNLRWHFTKSLAAIVFYSSEDNPSFFKSTFCACIIRIGDTLLAHSRLPATSPWIRSHIDPSHLHLELGLFVDWTCTVLVVMLEPCQLGPYCINNKCSDTTTTCSYEPQVGSHHLRGNSPKKKKEKLSREGSRFSLIVRPFSINPKEGRIWGMPGVRGWRGFHDWRP